MTSNKHTLKLTGSRNTERHSDGECMDTHILRIGKCRTLWSVHRDVIRGNRTKTPYLHTDRMKSNADSDRTSHILATRELDLRDIMDTDCRSKCNAECGPTLYTEPNQYHAQ